MGDKEKRAVKALCDEDKKLAEEIYREYGDIIRNHIRKKSPDNDSIDYYMSDTFCRMVINIDSFKNKSPEDILKLLYCIANSVIIEDYRKTQRRNTVPISSIESTDDNDERLSFEETHGCDTDIQNDAVFIDLKKKLISEINKMEYPEKDILLLHFSENKTTIEISSILGLKHSTVRTKLRRTLEALRKKLDNGKQ